MALNVCDSDVRLQSGYFNGACENGVPEQASSMENVLWGRPKADKGRPEWLKYFKSGQTLCRLNPAT